MTWRLSNKRDNLKDALLNHWNIHHLHLTGQDEPRWNRSELLFCVFDHDRVYVLGVWDHNVFDDTRPLFEFVDQFFPFLLPLRLPGAKLATAVDDKEYRPLREASITVPIALSDDELIYPTNLGVLGNGRCFVDSVRADTIRQLCRQGAIKRIDDANAQSLTW